MSSGLTLPGRRRKYGQEFENESVKVNVLDEKVNETLLNKYTFKIEEKCGRKMFTLIICLDAK